MRPRLVAIATFLLVLAMTALMDGWARSAHTTSVEADVSATADEIVRRLSDAVVLESAAVETLSVFVQIAGEDSARLDEDFPRYAEALMETSRNILSVQLGPDSILEYVFPVEGNEQAVGLNLMDDPDRRALLEPAIVSGETVIQGPVELVQGGVGLIVRNPVYSVDGEFWGFAAIVLDWTGIAGDSGLAALPSSMKAGLRRTGETGVIAGDATAFDGEPVTRTLRVGATATSWTLAIQPTDGWPAAAPTTLTLWIAGFLIALLSAAGVAQLLERPAALEAERKKALNDLALAEARYTATFQNAGVGIVVADPDGSLVSANRAFKSLVGIDETTDLTGVNFQEYVAADDISTLRAGARDVLSDGGVVEMDLRLSRGEEQRLCRLQLTSLQHQATSMLIAVVMDITARRVAEEALAQSELRYRHLFDSAPIAIERQDFSALKRRLEEYREAGVDDMMAFVDDPATLYELGALIRITDANPAAQALNQQLDSDAESIDPRGLEAEEARIGFIANLHAIRDGAESIAFPITRVLADGRRVHLDLRWQPVPTADGLDYSQVMVSIIDVTDLVEAKRGLQELLDSKDHFLASVAHELRTPLTSIVGFAHELRENPSLSPAENEEFVSLIAQNSMEMAHLIEDILVLARAEVGEVNVALETVDLSNEVAVVLRLLSDCDVRYEPDGREILATADPARVRQILRNLVTNAVRYGGDDLSIEVGLCDDGVYVDVRDDGVAIPPAAADVIFEPYRRLSNPTSVPGSIGLGLPVSRALAQAQDGDVTLRREGGHNVFRLTLPAAPAVSVPFASSSGESVG